MVDTGETSIITKCTSYLLLLGSSITSYLERLEEIKKSKPYCSPRVRISGINLDYKYRRDEIFRRIKATTFAQLVGVIFYNAL